MAVIADNKKDNNIETLELLAKACKEAIPCLEDWIATTGFGDRNTRDRIVLTLLLNALVRYQIESKPATTMSICAKKRNNNITIKTLAKEGKKHYILKAIRGIIECPFCNDDDIALIEEDMENIYPWRIWSCYNCGKEWTERYELVSIETDKN